MRTLTFSPSFKTIVDYLACLYFVLLGSLPPPSLNFPWYKYICFLPFSLFTFHSSPPPHITSKSNSFASATCNSIKMLRTVTKSLCRVSKSAVIARAAPVSLQTANLGTAEKKGSVVDAWNKSCYHEMDFTISEDLTVYDAVERFSAYDVGALVTIDSAGKNCFHPPAISTRPSVPRFALLFTVVGAFDSSSSTANIAQRHITYYTLRKYNLE